MVAPFPYAEPRAHTDGDFLRGEVRLANRNHGILLETLRHDVTPTGLHYLLTHFDVPFVEDAQTWTLAIGGRVARPRTLRLADILARPQRTLRVTLECAGNGRADISPRWPSMPWGECAVGTSEWTGTPLRPFLEEAGMAADAVHVVFTGADRGFDGVEHDYARALTPVMAMHDDVLLVTAMNGQPLLPQHGFPLRLIVPGWYGMASVKWLTRIDVIDQAFQGHQQVGTYVFRSAPGAPGVPVTTMRIKSLMVPPGIPDWFTRRRMVDAGEIVLRGRAWSGGGTPITRVEVSGDAGETWQDAVLEPPCTSPYAWRSWRTVWTARPGRHVLQCRAHDAAGNVQPLAAPFDRGGFGNNAVHRVDVTVR